MMTDTLDNASCYESLGPRFAEAFEHLRGGRAGAIAVFMPQDVRMPCIADGLPGAMRKVDVKVRVNG